MKGLAMILPAAVHTPQRHCRMLVNATAEQLADTLSDAATAWPTIGTDAYLTAAYDALDAATDAILDTLERYDR